MSKEYKENTKPFRVPNNINFHGALERQLRKAMQREGKAKQPQMPSQEPWEPSIASAKPQKRKATFETSASSPNTKRGIMITTHLPLGQEWVEQLGGMVVHSNYVLNPTTRFKVTYHTFECYKALMDLEVIPYLDACGLGKMRYKLLCKPNMHHAVQFVKNYNRNTKQTKVISNEGQEKVLTLKCRCCEKRIWPERCHKAICRPKKVGQHIRRGCQLWEPHKGEE